MNRRLIRSIFILFVFILTSQGSSAGQSNDNARLYDVEKGQEKDFSSILTKLKQKRIILVGEHHRTASHHRAQLEVIRQLHGAGVKLAVGLEMFRNDSQKGLNRWQSGDLDDRAFRRIFYDNWNYDWPLYRDIFLYARKSNIPMVGLNVPRGITRQVANEGYGSLNEEQRKRLGDVACRVDREYMAFIKRAYRSHGHGGKEFLYFCEAQMIWDNAMAVYALEYLKVNPTRVMVILAGTGHVRKQAVPFQISRRADISLAVFLPEVPGSIDRTTVDIDDADYIFLDLS